MAERPQCPLFTDKAGDLFGPYLLLGAEASLTQREGHIV